MIITIFNKKGGVAKTTTALVLAQGLQEEHTTVLIDLDSQCNLSYTMGADLKHTSILGALTEEVTAKDAIQRTQSGYIICGSKHLDNYQAEKESLKNALQNLKTICEYIIIDTPPTFNSLSMSALVCSDIVVIPTQADIYGLQGLYELKGIIERVQRESNRNLKIGGILLTRYNGRTKLAQKIAEQLKTTSEELNTKVFEKPIRESIAVKEAQTLRKPLFDYAPRSKATEDYKAFISEFKADMERGNNGY